MVPKRTFWLICCLAGTLVGWAQPKDISPEQARFFTQRAWSDARYEQLLQLSGDREELDFWKDQRAFERLLYRNAPLGYKAYIRAKREAYSRHQAVCDSDCRHGDYYFLHASFYLQMGSDSNGNDWVFGTEEAGRGLIAAGPEH